MQKWVGIEIHFFFGEKNENVDQTQFFHENISQLYLRAVSKIRGIQRLLLSSVSLQMPKVGEAPCNIADHKPSENMKPVSPNYKTSF